MNALTEAVTNNPWKAVSTVGLGAVLSTWFVISALGSMDDSREFLQTELIATIKEEAKVKADLAVAMEESNDLSIRLVEELDDISDSNRIMVKWIERAYPSGPIEPIPAMENNND